jgi:hypothetical protein
VLNGHLADGETMLAAGKYVIAEVETLDGDVANLTIEGLNTQKRNLII